jgi:hypothetical protein
MSRRHLFHENTLFLTHPCFYTPALEITILLPTFMTLTSYTHYISNLMHYLSLCPIISICIMSYRFVHVFTNDKLPFVFNGKWISHIFFLHSLIKGHLGGFCIFVVMSNAVVKWDCQSLMMILFQFCWIHTQEWNCCFRVFYFFYFLILTLFLRVVAPIKFPTRSSYLYIFANNYLLIL